MLSGAMPTDSPKDDGEDSKKDTNRARNGIRPFLERPDEIDDFGKKCYENDPTST